MLETILGRFLDWIVHDGISSELDIKQDEHRLADYCQPAEYSDFLELKSRTVNTRSKPDEIINSEGIDALMNGYFNDEIRMFPYEGSTSAARIKGATTTKNAANTPESSSARQDSDGADDPVTTSEGLAAQQGSETTDRTVNVSKAPSAQQAAEPFLIARGKDIEKPPRFYKVQIEMIERRFPGGRKQDIGDGDLRDQISSLRYTFARNYRHLILVRRGWTLLGAAAILASGLASVWVAGHASLLSLAADAMEPTPDGSAAGMVITSLLLLLFLAATSGATYMLLRMHHRRLTGLYTNAIKQSAAVLRASAVSRLHGIIDAMPDIFKKGEAAKQALIDEKRLDSWPLEGRKWPVLGVWMSRRVEHIQLFMQVEMWRIRRIQYGLRVIAQWLSFLVFVLSASTFAFLIWIGHLFGLFNLQLSFPLIVVYAGVLIGLAAISHLSFRAAIPDLNIIEDTLLSSELRGHRDTHLHTHTAELVYRLLGAILRAEETRAAR